MNRQNSIFARCKSIPAHEVAQREGLKLRKRGDKHWALCPFHGEKTPSLAFYPTGTWYCFGCHMGGDAVAFLAAYRGISPIEAARLMVNEWNPTSDPIPAQKERERKKLLAAEDQRDYDRLCDVIHTTAEVVAQREAVISDREALSQDLLFTTALEAFCIAQMLIDNLLWEEGT